MIGGTWTGAKRAHDAARRASRDERLDANVRNRRKDEIKRAEAAHHIIAKCWTAFLEKGQIHATRRKRAQTIPDLPPRPPYPPGIHQLTKRGREVRCSICNKGGKGNGFGWAYNPCGPVGITWARVPHDVMPGDPPTCRRCGGCSQDGDRNRFSEQQCPARKITGHTEISYDWGRWLLDWFPHHIPGRRFKQKAF